MLDLGMFVEWIHCHLAVHALLREDVGLVVFGLYIVMKLSLGHGRDVDDAYSRTNSAADDTNSGCLMHSDNL